MGLIVCLLHDGHGCAVQAHVFASMCMTVPHVMLQHKAALLSVLSRLHCL